MKQTLGVDGGQGRAFREQPGQHGCDVGSGEAAAGHFFASATEPGHIEILAAGGELDKVAQPTKEEFRLIALSKIHSNNRWEMPGPFTLHEVLVIAGRNDVAALDVSLVDPILVEQHLVLARTTEAAVQDMVAALDGLA